MMADNQIIVIPGRAYPLGVYKSSEGIHVSAVFHERGRCGICFYAGGGKGSPKRISFDVACRTGNLYSALVKGLDESYDSYLFFENETYFPDPHAREIRGLEKWGKPITERTLRCVIPKEYDWSGDIRPEIPYEQSFIYALHVRGFTKKDSVGVPDARERGTFQGLVRKIPYLKSLGVTTVELLPIYECLAVDTEKTSGDPNYGEVSGEVKAPTLYSHNGMLLDKKEPSLKINYWGYKDGFYFAPRSAYSSDPHHPVAELKSMIRQFHLHQMEVILQFYFAPGTDQNLMVDCIRYWVSEFHIDGIHVKSDNIPVEMLISDPMLSDLKIMYRDASRMGGRPSDGQCALYDEVFPFAARRFLRGEDYSIQDFVNAFTNNCLMFPRIHYLCNYDGFTLRDLFSYEHKHNEANGEHNADGRDLNFSFNCGQEGLSRSKTVLSLRKRQMLNGLTMLMLSHGTPLLYAGDECGNTQKGNNNPYCQDNALSWTDWDPKGKFTFLTDYIKALIAFRNRYPFLSNMDVSNTRGRWEANYPKISFHGREAWQPDLSAYSHAVGVMICNGKGTSDYIYIAFNLLWKKTSFALPKLPGERKWCLFADTASDSIICKLQTEVREEALTLEPRSISILIGRQVHDQKNDGRKDP